MIPIRVLIAGNSVVARRLLVRAIDAMESAMSLGSSANLRVTLARIADTNPDVTVFGLRDPVSQSVGLVRAVRRDYPSLPLLACIDRSEMLDPMVEAMARMQIPTVATPLRTGGGSEADPSTLIEVQRCLSQLVSPNVRYEPTPFLESTSPGSHSATTAPGIVVVGGSTGGPNALKAMLSQLPSTFQLPIIVAQHMPAQFSDRLAKQLDSHCALAVQNATPNCRIGAGTVAIIPGDTNASVKRCDEGVQLLREELISDRTSTPSVDILFESAARQFGARVLAIVLTGMGKDGLRGSEWVVHCHGHVWAQDRASSVVWGMPGAVTSAGLTELVLSPASIGQRLRRLADSASRPVWDTPVVSARTAEGERS